ncbi:MAG: tRNA pseudouridine(55) synthase TruB, partial [bacterium]
MGNGILLVDKPAGLTSFAVVDRVRAALGGQLGFSPPKRRGRQRYKCGHAGTLDPLATGLLLLLCGSGTRLSPFLMKLDKAYRATVRFGVGTDSHDAEGRLTEQQQVSCTLPDLAAAMAGFCGEIQQVPPIFSAIKRAGQPLYKAARRGEEVEPPAPRPVRIDRLELLDSRWGVSAETTELIAADGSIYEIDLELECSSGTYVRSLARDLAAAVGSVGTVTALSRHRIGSYRLEDAVPPAAIDDGSRLVTALQPLRSALPHLASLQLTPQEAALIRHGGQPEFSWLKRLDQPPPLAQNTGSGEEQHFQMRDPGGALVAIGWLAGTGGLPRSA